MTKDKIITIVLEFKIPEKDYNTISFGIDIGHIEWYLKNNSKTTDFKWTPERNVL